MSQLKASSSTKEPDLILLCSKPPIFGEQDERRKTDNYGLVHMLLTIVYHFNAVVSFLQPREAARLQQTRKIFISPIEEVEKQILMYLHQKYFPFTPFPSMSERVVTSAAAVVAADHAKAAEVEAEVEAEVAIDDNEFFSDADLNLHLYNSTIGQIDEERKGMTYTHYLHESMIELASKEGGMCYARCLHELLTDTSHKILLIGGNRYKENINRVDMMIINDDKISWQACAPMIKKHHHYGVIYNQGQVLAISNHIDDPFTCDRYDVLSQTTVTLEQEFPICNLSRFAIADLDGKVFIIGGMFMADELVISDRVFCLDMNLGQECTWIELPRLRKHLFDAGATAYQGKIWLANSCTSSIDVFDPFEGIWKKNSKLTKIRTSGSIGLFVINYELFAAGTNIDNRIDPLHIMWIEKYNKDTANWQLVCEYFDMDRNNCALAACGTKIYFFGGMDDESRIQFNSFDIITNTWTFNYEHRRKNMIKLLPRNFDHGQAVCITQNKELLALSTWTNFVNKKQD